ncbi:MAG: GTPase, partial [Oculatellaceae cyanobacterium Prado106]|nr:GTPase [Oculatellaceae cyanobacterium Prado106]
MVRLQPWQWVVLALPIASIVSFVLIAAGWQIHEWGVSWLWGVVTVLLVGWRWLLVRWTQPALRQVEDAIAQVNQELESSALAAEGESAGQGVIPGNAAASKINQAEAALQNVLQSAQSDRPFWEDWPMFWLRCQELVIAIAQIYNPDVKYPLLNIYIPQAYGLIRGTVDDMDQWMQKLSPALGQVTVGQAYQAYEVYRKLEPSARKVLQALGWAQWLLNPVAAIARRASWRYGSRANQQLLVNLSQLLREAA